MKKLSMALILLVIACGSTPTETTEPGPWEGTYETLTPAILVDPTNGPLELDIMLLLDERSACNMELVYTFTEIPVNVTLTTLQCQYVIHEGDTVNVLGFFQAIARDTETDQEEAWTINKAFNWFNLGDWQALEYGGVVIHRIEE